MAATGRLEKEVSMKNVLVTGSGSGLGKVLTQKYADLGYRVYALDVSEEGLGDLTGDNIIRLQCDISDENSWDNNVIPRIESDGKGLDIVIACASIMHIGNALDCSKPDWDKLNSINLTGQYLTANKTLPFLKMNRGNILFIGSPSALLAVRDEVCYVTFKHAVRGLNKSVAFDFGKDGIRSNIVHPGWIRTAMSDQEMQEIMDQEGCSLDEAYAIATRFVPLRRPAHLEEIWNAVEFLTSDKASYITGADLCIDGGLSIVDPGMVAFE